MFDLVSVVTTFKEELKKAGVIFMSISDDPRASGAGGESRFRRSDDGQVLCDPESRRCLPTARLFVPKGVRCPMEFSTYFRINEKNTGQFERTLIIAEEAPTSPISRAAPRRRRDENQLHAAVVELVALDDAEIGYSTVR